MLLVVFFTAVCQDSWSVLDSFEVFFSACSLLVPGFLKYIVMFEVFFSACLLPCARFLRVLLTGVRVSIRGSRILRGLGQVIGLLHVVAKP